MKQKIISFGITCYQENLEKIKKSINSLEDIENKEIIIHIDNNSELKNQIESEFQHLKVICSNENVGLGISRNKIIDTASSRWIAFLDAGDEYNAQVVNKHIEFFETSKVDFINFQIETIKENFNNFLTLSKSNYINALYTLNHRNMSQGTFYKIDYLVNNKIYYLNKNIYHEDLFFSLNVLSNTDNYFIISEKIYKWEQDDNKLSSSLNTKKINDLFILYKEKLNFYRNFSIHEKNLRLRTIYFYHVKFINSRIRISKKYYYIFYCLIIYLRMYRLTLEMKKEYV